MESTINDTKILVTGIGVSTNEHHKYINALRVTVNSDCLGVPNYASKSSDNNIENDGDNKSEHIYNCKGGWNVTDCVYKFSVGGTGEVRIDVLRNGQ